MMLQMQGNNLVDIMTFKFDEVILPLIIGPSQKVES